MFIINILSVSFYQKNLGSNPCTATKQVCIQGQLLSLFWARFCEMEMKIPTPHWALVEIHQYTIDKKNLVQFLDCMSNSIAKFLLPLSFTNACFLPSTPGHSHFLPFSWLDFLWFSEHPTTTQAFTRILHFLTGMPTPPFHPSIPIWP